jgi:hypothetical protein
MGLVTKRGLRIVLKLGLNVLISVTISQALSVGKETTSLSQLPGSKHFFVDDSGGLYMKHSAHDRGQEPRTDIQTAGTCLSNRK